MLVIWVLVQNSFARNYPVLHSCHFLVFRYTTKQAMEELDLEAGEKNRLIQCFYLLLLAKPGMLDGLIQVAPAAMEADF